MMNENTSDMTKTRRRSRKKQKTYHKTQEMEGSITQLFILNTCSWYQKIDVLDVVLVVHVKVEQRKKKFQNLGRVKVQQLLYYIYFYHIE